MDGVFPDPAAQASRDQAWEALVGTLDDQLLARVERVVRLTPTIVEVVVRAPAAAKHFEPGQFFRLQNFVALSRSANGSRRTSAEISAASESAMSMSFNPKSWGLIRSVKKWCFKIKRLITTT